MTTMPLSTANWHWKNKNVGPWAKTWFERELTTIAVSGDQEPEAVLVSGVTDFEGDVELGQRKSKLITIYDVKFTVTWTGTASDGTAVEGKVAIPEVSHEITLDGLSDYVYEWSLTTASSPAVDTLYKTVKTKLPTALETKFAEFPVVLIDTHGRDLQVGTPSASGRSTPAPSASTTGAAGIASSAPVEKAEPKKLNTSTVKASATFAAAADDLFSLFTDAGRIPAWTRAPAISEPKVGGEYALFGGGVKGKYVELEAPKKIVQSWALQSPTWPSGHTATLTILFDQQSDSTKTTFTLTGVPKGIEDEITRNIEGYYVHGLKSIGLGTEL